MFPGLCFVASATVELAPAEALGSLGVILPGLLRTRPCLTPLAAAGLVIIMIGATVLTLMSGGIALALMPPRGIRRPRPLAAGAAWRSHREGRAHRRVIFDPPRVCRDVATRSG